MPDFARALCLLALLAAAQVLAAPAEDHTPAPTEEEVTAATEGEAVEARLDAIGMGGEAALEENASDEAAADGEDVAARGQFHYAQKTQISKAKTKNIIKKTSHRHPYDMYRHSSPMYTAPAMYHAPNYNPSQQFQQHFQQQIQQHAPTSVSQPFVVTKYGGYAEPRYYGGPGGMMQHQGSKAFDNSALFLMAKDKHNPYNSQFYTLHPVSKVNLYQARPAAAHEDRDRSLFNSLSKIFKY